MIYLLCLPAALLGGLLYSLRGGMIGRFCSVKGDVFPRLIWCIPTGGLVALLCQSWLAWALAVVALYIGLLIPHGWTFLQHPWVETTLGRTGVGLGRSLAVLLFTAWLAVDPLLASAAYLLAGGLEGVGQFIGWRCPSPFPNWRVPYSGEMAEVFVGGFWWAAISTALIQL